MSNLHCFEIITGKYDPRASFKAIESPSSKEGRTKTSLLFRYLILSSLYIGGL